MKGCKMGDDKSSDDKNDVSMDDVSDDGDVGFNDVDDVRSDVESDDSEDDVVCVESNKVKTPTKVVDYPDWFND